MLLNASSWQTARAFPAHIRLGRQRTEMPSRSNHAITGALPELEVRLSEKKTGAEVLYDDDPVRLIEQLLDRYLSGSYVCPCYPEELTERVKS